MRRLDRYDAIGLALLGFVLALWLAHLILPSGPPPVPLSQ